MQDCYFPTMPQDDLDEVKEAVLAARDEDSLENPVFYSKCRFIRQIAVLKGICIFKRKKHLSNNILCKWTLYKLCFSLLILTVLPFK